MRKKITTVILILLFFFGGVYFFNQSDGGPYQEFDNIKVSAIFSQKKEEALRNNEYPSYYVYFYRIDCPDCQKLENKIISFAKKEDIFFINTRTKESKQDIYSFNWSNFNSNNDVEIGTVDNNEIAFYEGESREKYENSTELNIYNKTKKYKIVIANEEYMKINKNAQMGYVYASLITPEIDYSKVDMLKPTIELAGVPTLLKIHGYSIVESYYGTEEIDTLLSNLK